jgi:hypothetical protein
MRRWVSLRIFFWLRDLTSNFTIFRVSFFRELGLRILFGVAVVLSLSYVACSVNILLINFIFDFVCCALHVFCMLCRE